MTTQTSVTQKDVEALERAMTSGELQVRIGDRWITYRSVEELKMQLDWARAKVAEASGQTTNRRRAYVATVDRGVS